jgi:type II secretory pathway component PulM
MNLRELWERVRRWYATHSTRDRRILAGVAIAAVLSLVYVALIDPLVHYRRRVAEEIAEGQDELDRSARFLAAADSLRAERDDLNQRLAQAKQRLLPGANATLAAAALQERTNAIANEKGITVQSTQVMKEEPADPFRKVSIRLTLSGELKPLSELLSGVEYGPQQLTVPFIEVSRRGAIAGAKGPRTLAATVEVSGYLLAQEAKKPAEGESTEAEPEAALDANAPPEPGAAAQPAAKEAPPVEAAVKPAAGENTPLAAGATPPAAAADASASSTTLPATPPPAAAAAPPETPPAPGTPPPAPPSAVVGPPAPEATPPPAPPAAATPSTPPPGASAPTAASPPPPAPAAGGPKEGA